MLLEQQASTREAPAPAGNAALKVTGTRGLAHNPCQAPQGLCLSAHLTPHPLLVTTTYLLLCSLCNTRTARIRGVKKERPLSSHPESISDLSVESPSLQVPQTRVDVAPGDVVSGHHGAAG